jgi:hypothetical protein
MLVIFSPAGTLGGARALILFYDQEHQEMFK